MVTILPCWVFSSEVLIGVFLSISQVLSVVIHLSYGDLIQYIYTCSQACVNYVILNTVN